MARKGRRSSKDERIDAIRLLEQGYTKAQVARICNVTESSVYGWQKAPGRCHCMMTLSEARALLGVPGPASARFA